MVHFLFGGRPCENFVNLKVCVTHRFILHIKEVYHLFLREKVHSIFNEIFLTCSAPQRLKILAECLCNILNLSLAISTFLNSWKSCKSCPLFLKVDIRMIAQVTGLYQFSVSRQERLKS